jgi:hypothetical protein
VRGTLVLLRRRALAPGLPRPETPAPQDRDAPKVPVEQGSSTPAIDLLGPEDVARKTPYLAGVASASSRTQLLMTLRVSSAI